MVQEQAVLDRVFHALADPTRRAMLAELSGGERKIGDLAAPFDMSFSAASKHVRVLETAGLVRREVRGRAHVCRLEAVPLREAEQWLRDYERFWTERLDVLDALLRADDRTKQDRKRRDPK
jgi:DNA-binding transcriptional ArsR family regulator